MRRRSFDRRPAQRPVGRRLLIVCEDSETAPGYFHGIREQLRLSKEQVSVVSPHYTDPLNLVREAVRLREERKEVKDWEEAAGDHAWAVFDGDEHIANNPHNWHNALDLAKTHEIEVAIANPSFEFWYLLHFEEHSAALHRDRALVMLKRHLPRYEKSFRLYPTPLESRTAQAIERALNLARRAQNLDLNPHANPCCEGVARLVQSLLGLRS